MSLPNRLTAILVMACLFAFGCIEERQAETPAPLSASDTRVVMAERFAALHQAYLLSDADEYTALLRATLRHARRLEPAQCVVFQRQLIEIGNAVGYDGLEPVWLVYQDCAAAGDNESVGTQRLKNAYLMREGLRFAREPLPQLPLRVTHWNSTIERGTRGDAVRVLLRQFKLEEPSIAHRWSMHQLLSHPAVSSALCGLPVWVNQSKQVALPELIRQVGCTTGAGPNPKDICDALFPGQDPANGAPGPGNMAVHGISDEDGARLQDFCSGLTGAGSASAAGIDNLDAYSSDQCTSEGTTKLYETAKIVDLVLECHFSDRGSPIAESGTSADILSPRFLNVILEYPLDDETQGAALVVGRSADDPGRKFYGAYGDSPEEARKALLDQLANNPPQGYIAEKQFDGSVVLQGEYDVENPDGSMSRVRDAISVGPDGSFHQARTQMNADGSGRHGHSSQNSDGSSRSVQLEWDSEGKVTKKTGTQTDKDGNTTTLTTEYEYDDDGTVTNTTTSTSTGTTTPGEMGGIDPHNPACQELMALDVIPGGSGKTFWADLFNRPYGGDPRTVYPAPDDEANWSNEPFCGAPGLGNTNARAKCRIPVLCTPGTDLDDSCTCREQIGGSIALRGCTAIRCPDGTTPVPVGANACTCQADWEGPPGSRPPPGPRPDVTHAFSESIWSRPGGKIFVTDEVARRHNTALEDRPR